MGTIDRDIAIRDARAARQRSGNTRAHTLRVRLDNEQHRRLRRFLARQEGETGQRITHQAVLEAALLEYLERHTPPLC